MWKAALAPSKSCAVRPGAVTNITASGRLHPIARKLATSPGAMDQDKTQLRNNRDLSRGPVKLAVAWTTARRAFSQRTAKAPIKLTISETWVSGEFFGCLLHLRYSIQPGIVYSTDIVYGRLLWGTSRAKRMNRGN